MRGADVCVYQDDLGKTIVIRKSLQLLVSLEVTGITHNDNEVNSEPANKRPRGLASAQYMSESKLLF